MTLDRLRPLVDRTLAPFVAGFDRLGLSPDGVSVLAFLVAVAAGGCFALGPVAPVWYVAGAVLVGVNGTLDVVDGALARRQGVEGDAGDLFDHVLDRYADVAVVAGLAAGTEAYALGFAAVTGVLEARLAWTGYAEPPGDGGAVDGRDDVDPREGLDGTYSLGAIFHAEAVGGDLRPEPDETDAAGWFSAIPDRENLVFERTADYPEP